MKLQWSHFSTNPMGFHIARIQHGHDKTPLEHSHMDFVELFWVNSGKGKHIINGHDNKLSQGNLVFVRQNDRHTLQAPARNKLDFTNLAFSSKILNGIKTRYFSGKKVGHWSKDILPTCINLSGEQLVSLNIMAEDLAKADNERINIELFYIKLLKDLFLNKQVEVPEQSCPHWLSQAMLEFRDEKYLEPGLAQFFHLCGCSQAHITRTMRKHLNTTPSHFVNEVRLSYAAQQLRITAKPILEICYESGFENPGYFYRLFKMTYKLSPKVYRKQQMSPMNLL